MKASIRQKYPTPTTRGAAHTHQSPKRSPECVPWGWVYAGLLSLLGWCLLLRILLL